MNQPHPSLFAELRRALNALGGELREMIEARWELARLEIQADLRSAMRLLIVWLVALVVAMAVLPLLAVGLAEWLNGVGGISRVGWLLIIAASLATFAPALAYLAWWRFRRKFLGLRETIEELREDVVWLREKRGLDAEEIT